MDRGAVSNKATAPIIRPIVISEATYWIFHHLVSSLNYNIPPLSKLPKSKGDFHTWHRAKLKKSQALRKKSDS